MTTISVATPDGRELEVRDEGMADGFALVLHSGTPTGAVALPWVERAASERRLRLISYSRPGYGASTPRPDGATTGTVADDVRDTEVILDHLGVDQFVTIGWSGGGPRALGCAALLPQRCRAAAVVAGPVPPDRVDWDFREGMAAENVEEYTAVMEGAAAVESFLAQQEALFTVTGDQVAESLGGLAPEVDRAVLSGEVAEAMAASFRAAGRQGTVGWRDDDLTMFRPWEFDLAAITVPVSVWAGRQDTMVPFRHGEWLAANVAGARAHLLDDAGHLSLMVPADRVLDDLLDLAGRGS